LLLICWLNRVLPGEVVPYGESRRISRLTRDVLASRSVWTLGAQQIECIAEKCADAFVNTHSFAEMPKRVMDNYFSRVNRITSGVLYSKQREVERNVIDNVEVTLDTYPVQPGWRLLFYETSTLYEGCFEAAYAMP